MNLILAIAIGLAAITAWSQEAAGPLAYPPLAIAPAREVGIDRARAAPSRAGLRAFDAALRAAFSQAPRTLTAYVGDQRPQRFLTLNQRRDTDQIYTGNGRDLPPELPLVVEPIWCQVMDRYLLFVQIMDAEKWVVLGSDHTSFPREQWRQAARSGNLGALLTGQAAALATRATQRLRAKIQGEIPPNALHVRLNLGHHVTRQDEGSSHCLNLLLEEALAPEMTVLRSVGSRTQGVLRRALGQPAALRRATRVANLKWAHQLATEPDRTLPVTLKLTATFADSVLGQPIPGTHRSEWTFALEGRRIGFQVPPELLTFLRGERDNLSLADSPQVARIDRAWVYLDRGRAWGLKMNDRMIARTPKGKLVKGHVVRFFGPAEGLTSPRGFPIHEGAILYIRKGQRLTEVGMEFHFDPRSYPTPWPPKKTASP